MAYNGSNVALQDDLIAGIVHNFIYMTTDSLAAVEAAGYFTDGFTRGMRLNDIVWVVNTASGNVAIVSVTGAGTAAAPAVTVSGMVVDPGMQMEFGSSTGTFNLEGNLNRQISAAGISPGATAADNVLAVYTLPANAFDVAGRGLNIVAEGSFAATANNKRVKIIFNPATAVVGSTVGASGTTIADTGTVATNGTGWSLEANVFKYGAAGSNTQIGLHQQAQVGAAVASLLVPSLITAAENGAILIAITGNATTAASDILFNFLEVNAMN